MKIKIKYPVILLLVILVVVTFITLIYPHIFVSSSKSGYFIYTTSETSPTSKICVYDVKNDTELFYKIDGYDEISNISQYPGGDFCCIGRNIGADEQKILLFKNGSIEKEIALSHNIWKVKACDNTVNVLAENEEHLEVYSISTNDESYITLFSIPTSEINKIAMNSYGGIVYLKEEEKQDGDDRKYELYYCYKDYKKSLGKATNIIGWINDEKLAVFEKESGEKSKESASYIIDISSGEKVKEKALNRESLFCFSPSFIAANSPDGSKILFWSAIKNSVDEWELGICDLSSGAIDHDRFKKTNLPTDKMDTNFLWLENNPFELPEDGVVID